MFLALAATGLRNSLTNFLASKRISMILLRRAKSGARGKEATKRVTIPNWITKGSNERRNQHSMSEGGGQKQTEMKTSDPVFQWNPFKAWQVGLNM